jgi:antitoxin component YwqK of YwqJK toxin-antitoxin module
LVKECTSDGKLISKMSFVKGIPDNYVSYYSNGQILSKGNFKKGVLDLYVQQLVQDSNERVHVDGEWISYTFDGKIIEITNYSVGLKNGPNVRYYENGQIQSKVNYTKGIPEGEYISYFTNGQIQRKGSYKMDSTSNLLLYHPLNMRGEIGLDGEWIEYYENGEIKCKGNYKDGIKIDDWYFYYENGQIQISVNFKEGFLFTEEMEYSSNETIINELKLRKGSIPIGDYTSFYSSGMIQETGFFVELEIDSLRLGLIKKTDLRSDEDIDYYEDNFIYGSGFVGEEFGYIFGPGIGILNGEWLQFYENGELKSKQNYNNGIRDGEWLGYHDDGKPRDVRYYYNGLLNDSIIGYDRNKKVVYKGFFKNGTGDFVSYFSDNFLIKSQGRFVNGVKEGEWLKGNVNRRLTPSLFYQKGMYINGERQGNWISYPQNDPQKITRIKYVNGVLQY